MSTTIYRDHKDVKGRLSSCVLSSVRAFGPICSKLTTSLVNEILKFKVYCTQKCCQFLPKKNVKSFAVQKLLTLFQQKFLLQLIL